MLDLFFKKTEINRIRTLLLFYSHKEVTLHQIQHQTKTPITTASRLVSDLNADINDIFGDQLTITLENKAYILNYTTKLNQTEVIGRLGHSYLNSSITFKIISHIFTEKNNSLVQLCADINVSQSYVYKKLVEINKTISSFNIKITNKQGSLTIDGSENSILLLTYAILEIEKKVFPLSAELVSAPNIYKYFDLIEKKLSNPYEKRSLNSLYDTVQLRRQSLESVTFIHLENREIIESMLSVVNLYDCRKDIKPLSHNSSLFINFIARCCINGTLTFEERVLTGKALGKLTNNKVVTYAIELVEVLAANIVGTTFSSKDNYWEALYICTLQLCYIDLFSADILLEFKRLENYHLKTRSNTRQREETNKKIAGLLDLPTFPYTNWSTKQYNDLIPMLKKWAHGLSFSKKEIKFKIMFYFSNFIVANLTIKELIITHFSDTFIEFVTSIDEADLLITDTFSILPDGLQYFLFHDFEEESLYETLLMAIAEVSHKKFINLSQKD